MERVCVYCGSRPGTDPAYVAAAEELGHELAERDIGLVFGGGSVGMMGAVADSVLAAGGEVVGVIPEALEAREVAHQGVTELRVVDSMHTRKQTMVELSDGFIALPGGLGTLEELMEILTWAQLGLHEDPCGIANVAGYYDGLVEFFDHAVEEGYVGSEHRKLALVEDDPVALLDRFEEYEPPVVERWLERDQT